MEELNATDLQQVSGGGFSGGGFVPRPGYPLPIPVLPSV